MLVYYTSLISFFCLQPEMKTILTDTIVECIYNGMENMDVGENYRRVAVIRYLGELYNYKLIGTTSIFSVCDSIKNHFAIVSVLLPWKIISKFPFLQILYLLICYDIVTVHQVQWEHADPPSNLMRVRLVCTLLKTCGDYLNHGANKKKLNYFILYFQV